MKNYNEESNEGYFLEVNVKYIKNLHGLHNDSPLLPEWMKIENWDDETEYVIHIGNFKQALNHGLVLKKIHRVIKFNQNV